MRHALRTIALALAIAATPACASVRAGQTEIVNPVSAARTLDQRAYALLHSYAAIIEEATDIVRDPAAPMAFKRALGQAERIATPAAETLEIAIAAYVNARADFEAAHERKPAHARTRRNRPHHRSAPSRRSHRRCANTGDGTGGIGAGKAGVTPILNRRRLAGVFNKRRHD